MAVEWLVDLMKAAGDSLDGATQRWRTANRFGCIFAFFALCGVVWLLVAAFGGAEFRPGGWWVCGGFAAVGVVGAAVCFWLGSRPDE
jgi:hypothetical protein